MTERAAKQMAEDLNKTAAAGWAYQAMQTTGQSAAAQALGVTPCYVRRIRPPR